MRKTKYIYLYSFASLLMLCSMMLSCSDESNEILSAEQQELIGRAVDFNASVADAYLSATRGYYDDSGVFNDYELMRIFREYWENGSWGAEEYRTYHLATQTASGTSILLNRNWKVRAGKKGKRSEEAEEFVQTDADSLTWDNGKTVRFRAWSRSNFGNSAYSDDKAYYYPDFCISDYCNVSGPTKAIPLVMKHLGCRIVFSVKESGNELHSVEICTDWKDYKRADNSDTEENDNSADEAGKTDELAMEECQRVREVYERMCMPAGVDIQLLHLRAMTASYYDEVTDFKDLENADVSELYCYGTEDANYIRDKVKRPVFNKLYNSCYLISIPYDMSDDVARQGETLVLPACTRFRVWLRDVNNGDGENTAGQEGSYHIFTLSDIKDEEGNALYAEGLPLRAGYSYRFRVGYRYKTFTITADDNFSWTEQDSEEKTLEGQQPGKPVSASSDYLWWKKAIKDAIPQSTSDVFNPVFHIRNAKEFLEFVNLVNATATNMTTGLYRAKRDIVNPEREDLNTSDKYNWWYEGIDGSDTLWITTEEAEKRGYIFYQHYHAANADKAAYSEEDYLRGSYPFYNEDLNRRFTVYLDADLDLSDWLISRIGTTEGMPFKGNFDGQGHRISNLYTAEGHLFGYTDGAAIRNLTISSTHNVMLLDNGTNGGYIVGVSVLGNSSGASIASRLMGTSYVIGCQHIGTEGKALVGIADDLTMQGCMQAAVGIVGGALLGDYADAADKFLSPQISYAMQVSTKQWNQKPVFGRFMCNYYDKSLSPDANAVSNIKDDYSRLEYIRGAKTYVMNAVNDNLLQDNEPYGILTEAMRQGYYGLAPWKAMNYAIYNYNKSSVGNTHPCNVHYLPASASYSHRYPSLVPNPAAPGDGTGLDYSKINPLEQNN